MGLSKNVLPVGLRQAILNSLPDQVVTSVSRVGYGNRLARLQNMVAEHTKGVVQSGPFKGTKIVAGGDRATKLLGSYEEELATVVEGIVAAHHDRIINVGCADGYYAVGLAKRMPAADVYAFDISEKAQDDCSRNAQQNGLAGRITVAGLCSPERLTELAQGASKPLAVIDVDGAELDLILPAGEALSRTTMLIECHDYITPGVTDRLTTAFQRSHTITRTDQGGRDPHRSPVLRELDEDDRWLLISEHRPVPMHWLYLQPK
jgi:predicted O-methyltransferase YrrM